MPSISEQAHKAKVDVEANANATAQTSVYEYKHKVETCECGVCYKSRVDSGTQGAHEKRVYEAAEVIIACITSTREDLSARQDRVNYYAQKYCDQNPTSGLTGIIKGAIGADSTISKASKVSGGSAGSNDTDFAKNLFAEMGSPYDSKCPHGLPFYACMSCSH